MPLRNTTTHAYLYHITSESLMCIGMFVVLKDRVFVILYVSYAWEKDVDTEISRNIGP